jgi:hypothetical protein
MRMRTWTAAALAVVGLLMWALETRAGDLTPLKGGEDAPAIRLDGKGNAVTTPTAVRVGVGPRGVRVGVGRPGFRVAVGVGRPAFVRGGVFVGPRTVVVGRGWWGPRRVVYWGPWGGWWWGRPVVVIRTGPGFYTPPYVVGYPYPVAVPAGTIVTNNTYSVPATIQPGVSPIAPTVGPDQNQTPPEGTYDYDGGPAQPVPLPTPQPNPGPTSGTAPSGSTAPLRPVSVPAGQTSPYRYPAYGEGR